MSFFTLHATFQLVLSLAAVVVLHILTQNHVFLKLMATQRIIAYMMPNDDLLRELFNPPPEDQPEPLRRSRRARNRAREGHDDEERPSSVFRIHTSNLYLLNIPSRMLTVEDLIVLPRSSELEWIVDLSFLTMVIVALTETLFWFYPEPDAIRFIIIWPLLVMLYCTKILAKMAKKYIQNELELGERYIFLWALLGFSVLSLTIVVVDEEFLELDLIDSYRSLYASFCSAIFGTKLEKLGPKPPHVPFDWTFGKAFVAIIATYFGVILTFPGLRCGQLYQVLVDFRGNRGLDTLLYNTYFLSTFFICSLWIKPFARERAMNPAYSVLDDNDYSICRIYCVVIIAVGKCFLVVKFIEGFLETAESRLARIRRRGGWTTNKAVMNCVTAANNNLPLIGLHFLLPLFLCMHSGVVHKIWGDFKWGPMLFKDMSVLQHYAADNYSSHSDQMEKWPPILSHDIPYANMTRSHGVWAPVYYVPPPIGVEAADIPKLLDESLIPFTDILNDYQLLRDLFQAKSLRGITGFFCWWIHFAWLCSTTSGAVYYYNYGVNP